VDRQSAETPIDTSHTTPRHGRILFMAFLGIGMKDQNAMKAKSIVRAVNSIVGFGKFLRKTCIKMRSVKPAPP
jgi:precorrin-3B methylase